MEHPLSWNRSNAGLFISGLDTVATVFVNGKEVGNSDNMFRRYSFDIKSDLVQLKSDQTPIEISIAFESPINYSERKFEEQKNNYYVVPPGSSF